jgi:hypothetical protein
MFVSHEGIDLREQETNTMISTYLKMTMQYEPATNPDEDMGDICITILCTGYILAKWRAAIKQTEG